MLNAKDYENALRLAIEKHAGQTRKNGDPYIIHPIKVSLYIKDQGYGLEYQIAALFHDLLEDTDVSEEEIAKYGENILEAVKLVSKNYCPDKKTYVPNIVKNEIARIVKEADRIDNLKDAANSGNPEFIKKYIAETREKYIEYFPAVIPYLEELEKLQDK